jgi:predicted NBD/HSP70 family sugar kinase
LITDKATSPQLMKTFNQQRVLNIIFADGPISRIDIAEKTGLTQQTITNIVGRLLEGNLVLEGRTSSLGTGRKPIPLLINSSQLYAIGIEVTVKYIRGILMDFNHHVLAEFRKVTQAFESEEDTFDCLVEVIDTILSEVEVQQQVKGIGVSIQGIVDKKEGVIINAPSLKWENYFLKEKLENRFSIPIYLENDVNIIAVVENLNGSLSSSTNNLTIKLDQGIGGAVVIDKKLHTGNHNMAGEFGHYKAFYGGDALSCHCGGRGCLTTIASIGSLERLFSIEFEQIILKFKNGENEIREKFKKIADGLTNGLCNMITFLNPDHVLITGEMVERAGFFLMPYIQDGINRLVPSHSKEVVISQLNEIVDAALMAARLVINEMFQLPEIFHK